MILRLQLTREICNLKVGPNRPLKSYDVIPIVPNNNLTGFVRILP
jgi:hypothetical protein